MPETTKKARDVFAAGLIAVVALELLVSFLLLFKGVSNAGFADKSIPLSGTFVDPIWIVLLVVAVVLVTHWGPPSRSARPLTLAALAVLAVALLLGVVTWIAALSSDLADSLGSFAGRPFAAKVAGTFVLLGYFALTALATWFVYKTLTALPRPVRASKAGQQWGQPAGWGPQAGQPGHGWGQQQQQWGQPQQQWGGAQPGQPGQQFGGQQQDGAQPGGGWGGPGSAYEAQAWGQPASPGSYGPPEQGQQPAYDPQGAYGQQPYDLQAGYGQPAYDPQAAYGQQPYDSQAGYGRPAYDPQAAYGQQPYDSQAGYGQQSGYSQPESQAWGQHAESQDWGQHDDGSGQQPGSAGDGGGRDPQSGDWSSQQQGWDQSSPDHEVPSFDTTTTYESAGATEDDGQPSAAEGRAHAQDEPADPGLGGVSDETSTFSPVQTDADADASGDADAGPEHRSDDDGSGGHTGWWNPSSRR